MSLDLRDAPADSGPIAVSAHPSDFSVQVLTVAPDASRVVVAGEIDMATGPEVREALTRQMAEGRDVVLDLTGVTFLDSSGLAILVEAINAAETTAWNLGVVSDLPLPVRRLLELTGLEAALPLVEG